MSDKGPQAMPPTQVRHPNLEQLIGRKVVLETVEGSLQSGTVSNIVYQTTMLLGVEVKSPSRIIFNNDASDFADWALVKSITYPVKAAA